MYIGIGRARLEAREAGFLVCNKFKIFFDIIIYETSEHVRKDAYEKIAFFFLASFIKTNGRCCHKPSRKE